MIYVSFDMNDIINFEDSWYFIKNIEPIMDKFNGYIVGNFRTKYIFMEYPVDMYLKLKNINIKFLKHWLTYKDSYSIRVEIENNQKLYDLVMAVEDKIISLKDFDYIQNYIYKVYNNKNDVIKYTKRVYFNCIEEYDIFEKYIINDLKIKCRHFYV